MAGDLLKVLERLNQKMGRYAASSERIAANSGDAGSCRLWDWDAKAARFMQSYVRDEIRKAKGGK